MTASQQGRTRIRELARLNKNQWSRREIIYLEDVRLGTSHATGNGLDEAGDLAHDINTIQSLAERSIDLGGHILTICGLAGPLPLDGGGLGPAAGLVRLRASMGYCVSSTGVDDLVILENSTNVDLGGAVGGGSGKLHHDGGIGGSLEVNEVPAGS